MADKNNDRQIMENAINEFRARMYEFGGRIGIPEPADDGEDYDAGRIYPIIRTDGKPAAHGRSCFVTVKEVPVRIDGSADKYTMKKKKTIYHYETWERGRMNEAVYSAKMDEVLEHIFNAITFTLASAYEKEHRIDDGSDYRRVMFAKEIELMSSISDKFGADKKAETDGILRKHPYKDNK